MAPSSYTPPQNSAGHELPGTLHRFARALANLDTSNSPSEAITAFEKATSALGEAYRLRIRVEQVNPPPARGSVMPEAPYDPILARAAETAMEAADQLLASALDKLLDVLRTHFPEASAGMRDLLPPIAQYVAAHSRAFSAA